MWGLKTDWDEAVEPGIKMLWNQWVAGLTLVRLEDTTGLRSSSDPSR